jgi:hypothetical protein
MWAVLAIDPTDDPKAIRRAYAARLKQIDPDRERETFVQLREALEWALARARHPAPSRPPPSVVSQDADQQEEAPPPVVTDLAPARQDVEASPARSPAALHKLPATPPPPIPPPAASPPPPPPALPALAQERANERAVLIGLDTALQRGDAREAWRLYVRAAAIGALPLGGTDRMLARLFTVALDDPTFDGVAFRELARSLGWDRTDLGSPAVADVRQRVDLRLSAEAWYDKLVTIAHGISVQTRPQAQAARLLLGRVRGRGLIGISRPTLRQLLDQLEPHAMWLRDRIPASRVAILERSYRRREIIAAALGAACVGFLLLQAIVVLIRAAASRELNPAGGVALAGFILFLAWGFWRVVKNLVRRWGDRPM